MDILAKARRLESVLTRTLDTAAQNVMKAGAREPLEIMHAIVDTLAREVQPAGRGRYLFPFNRIRVSIAAARPEARARFEAVLDGVPSLRDRIVERLRRDGCEPSELVVKTAYVASPDASWTTQEFHVELTRVTPAIEVIAPAPPTPASIELTLLNGSAEQPVYSLTLARIDLGRCAEVRDSRNRLLRTNHVAFADDADEPNQSVSRRHAHIDYAAASGHFRLYDDRSVHGTGILRDGRTIEVPPGSRGVRLQSEDVIVLGEARLRVKL